MQERTRFSSKTQWPSVPCVYSHNYKSTADLASQKGRVSSQVISQKNRVPSQKVYVLSIILLTVHCSREDVLTKSAEIMHVQIEHTESQKV